MRDNPLKGNGMKRLRRIIFSALTVISLLFFLATVVLWVRSYWVTDRVWLTTGMNNQNFGILTGRGGFGIGVLWLDGPPFGVRPRYALSIEQFRPATYPAGEGLNITDSIPTTFGFGYAQQHNQVLSPFHYGFRSVIVPMGCLTFLFAFAPAI